MQTLLELLRELRLSFPTAAAVIIGFLVLQGALDRLGEYMASQARAKVEHAQFMKFVSDSCTPKTRSQRAISKINQDNKLACSIYDNLEYGMAATVVSAAVMERPN